VVLDPRAFCPFDKRVGAAGAAAMAQRRGGTGRSEIAAASDTARCISL